MSGLLDFWIAIKDTKDKVNFFHYTSYYPDQGLLYPMAPFSVHSDLARLSLYQFLVQL
jgi:hypothetical protein